MSESKVMKAFAPGDITRGQRFRVMNPRSQESACMKSDAVGRTPRPGMILETAVAGSADRATLRALPPFGDQGGRSLYFEYTLDEVMQAVAGGNFVPLRAETLTPSEIAAMLSLIPAADYEALGHREGRRRVAEVGAHRYCTETARETGRTTRMLVQALAAASEGHPVRVVAASAAFARQLTEMLGEYGARCGIDMSAVRTSSVGSQDRELAPDELVMRDHHGHDEEDLFTEARALALTGDDVLAVKQGSYWPERSLTSSRARLLETALHERVPEWRGPLVSVPANLDLGVLTFDEGKEIYDKLAPRYDDRVVLAAARLRAWQALTAEMPELLDVRLVNVIGTIIGENGGRTFIAKRAFGTPSLKPEEVVRVEAMLGPDNGLWRIAKVIDVGVALAERGLVMIEVVPVYNLVTKYEREVAPADADG